MQKQALIVDDERSTCDLIEKVLSSVGIKSVSLTTSSEAPPVLRRGRFAVAFLDYQMAQPDGPELTRQMRDSVCNRLTPIVLLSDDQRPNAVSNGFKAGASFFFYKPVDRDHLLRLVRATHAAIEQVQRRTRRVPLRSKVRLQFCGQEFEAESIDVSMEGLLITTPRIIPLGSSVGVCLHLGKSMSPIVGAGSVVRLYGKNQMGIRLGRLDITESQRLQEFLLPLIPGE